MKIFKLRKPAMKNVKKILSIALVSAMLMGMSLNASAMCNHGVGVRYVNNYYHQYYYLQGCGYEEYRKHAVFSGSLCFYCKHLIQ